MAKPIKGKGKEPKTAGAGDSGDGLYDDKTLAVTGTGEGDDDNSRPVLEVDATGWPNKRLLFLDREFQIPGVDYDVASNECVFVHSKFKPHRVLTVIDLTTGDVYLRWNPINGDLA
jgi:hypothetical protein